MNMLTLLVAAAALATVVAFASGISAMAHDGKAGYRRSAEWMVLRVAFQALAFLFIVAALSGW